MRQVSFLALFLTAIVASLANNIAAQGLSKAEPLQSNPFAKDESFGGEMANDEKRSWPEVVGMDGEVAKQQIEKEVPDKDVFLVPAGSMVTMDYREDRIRIWLDESNKVARAPTLG